jgi:hypothetical protein
MEKEFDMVPDQKILKIGNRSYNVTRVTAERALKAMKVYNAMITSKVETEEAGIDKILDSVLILFRIDFEFVKAWEWFRRRIVSKQWILRHVSYEELNDFVETALEPILGPKKKEMEHRKALIDVERELLKKYGPEELAGLLESLLSSLDGPVKKS